MTRFTIEGIERLNARRGELMAQMLPTSRGGDGTGHSVWPAIQVAP